MFVVPLLLTQFSFRRYAAIRESTRCRPSARCRGSPSSAATPRPGTPAGSASSSVAVGRELGMSDAELLDLEYAALMHDIGQLSLAEPIPGGATVVAAPADQRRIAGLGADVIRQTGVLDEVAADRRPAGRALPAGARGAAPDVPLAAGSSRPSTPTTTWSATPTRPARRLDALERLRLGMAYEYDPTVVDSLSKTVERSARLGV